MKPPFDLDRAGAVASTLCAIHCAAIPILLGFGAAGAVSWLDHEPVEWGFVGIAAVIGTVSAWRGYRVHGNKPVAIVLATAALSLLALTWTSHASHGHTGSLSWLFPLIGVVIAVSHVVNRRLCNSCRSCEAHAHEPAPARERP
ncbi:MAG: MerC domain-containing protein [Planctomycetes bacterium]|nr:MerC domain-containing protein [Planctomycetota bacterium]